MIGDWIKKNLRGPRGPRGERGFPGPVGPTGRDGQDGEPGEDHRDRIESLEKQVFSITQRLAAIENLFAKVEMVSGPDLSIKTVRITE